MFLGATKSLIESIKWYEKLFWSKTLLHKTIQQLKSNKIYPNLYGLPLAIEKRKIDMWDLAMPKANFICVDEQHEVNKTLHINNVTEI